MSGESGNTETKIQTFKRLTNVSTPATRVGEAVKQEMEAEARIKKIQFGVPAPETPEETAISDQVIARQAAISEQGDKKQGA